jgi:hypothetical protein
MMRKLMLGALGAATMLAAVPATAQELPLVPGDYWDVTAVKIDDGHFAEYADFLAANFRKSNEFSKSKGWIKDYHILSNVNPRKDEADLYLVTVFDHVPTAAEQNEREKAFNAFMATSTRKSISESGSRATYRHITDDQLLQELVWAH